MTGSAHPPEAVLAALWSRWRAARSDYEAALAVLRQRHDAYIKAHNAATTAAPMPEGNPWRENYLAQHDGADDVQAFPVTVGAGAGERLWNEAMEANAEAMKRYRVSEAATVLAVADAQYDGALRALFVATPPDLAELRYKILALNSLEATVRQSKDDFREDQTKPSGRSKLLTQLSMDLMALGGV